MSAFDAEELELLVQTMVEAEPETDEDDGDDAGAGDIAWTVSYSTFRN